MYLLAQACGAKEITERYYLFLEPKADSIKNRSGTAPRYATPLQNQIVFF